MQLYPSIQEVEKTADARVTVVPRLQQTTLCNRPTDDSSCIELMTTTKTITKIKRALFNERFNAKLTCIGKITLYYSYYKI